MFVPLAGKNALWRAVHDAAEGAVMLLEHHERRCLCAREFRLHVLSWHKVVGDWHDLQSCMRKIQSLPVVYRSIYAQSHRMVYVGRDVGRSPIQSPRHPNPPPRPSSNQG